MRSVLIALAVMGVAVAGLLGPAPAAAQDTLTVTSWGGAYQESQRKAYFEPYLAKAGVRVLEDEWGGDMAQIRAQVQTGKYKWHVVDVETDHVLAGCDEGLLERIDYAKIGPKGQFLDGATHECGVGTISWSTIYAYNADLFPPGQPRPTTAADFFDLKKFPGKRGMWKSPKHNIEFAMIADGVPVRQLYDVLRTPEGVARAFRKLDTIKSQIVWWEAGAQPPQMLSDKVVVMTTAWNGRIYDAVVKHKKNFVIVWDGQALDLDWFVIPKGHPQKELALKFIAFASTPEVQANQSKYISYGPTTRKALELIDRVILKDLPTAPANTKNYYQVNSKWWADRREELTEKFNAWAAK
ncbi:MAG: ABC transporter substrate-binding protein [Candidatus Rokubacteria bacterium]|nr:ABC transporter substrate-binding protein [Candidatus Rokubacteria bacterium]